MDIEFKGICIECIHSYHNEDYDLICSLKEVAVLDHEYCERYDEIIEESEGEG